MELLKADLVLGVVLADEKEDKFVVTNVNAAMDQAYITRIVNHIKNTFEIDGQNIKEVKSIDVIHTQKQAYETVVAA